VVSVGFGGGFRRRGFGDDQHWQNSGGGYSGDDGSPKKIGFVGPAAGSAAAAAAGGVERHVGIGYDVEYGDIVRGRVHHDENR